MLNHKIINQTFFILIFMAILVFYMRPVLYAKYMFDYTIDVGEIKIDV